MNKRLECQIFGKVRMVMFRDFVKRNADKLGLVGTVENMKDNSVFVVAEGGAEKLEELLARLKKGPIFAKVLHVEDKWLPVTGAYRDFKILLYGRQN